MNNCSLIVLDSKTSGRAFEALTETNPAIEAPEVIVTTQYFELEAVICTGGEISALSPVPKKPEEPTKSTAWLAETPAMAKAGRTASITAIARNFAFKNSIINPKFREFLFIKIFKKKAVQLSFGKFLLNLPAQRNYFFKLLKKAQANRQIEYNNVFFQKKWLGIWFLKFHF